LLLGGLMRLVIPLKLIQINLFSLISTDSFISSRETDSFEKAPRRRKFLFLSRHSPRIIPMHFLMRLRRTPYQVFWNVVTVVFVFVMANPAHMRISGHVSQGDKSMNIFIVSWIFWSYERIFHHPITSFGENLFQDFSG
jgi:hypothetical protein